MDQIAMILCYIIDGIAVPMINGLIEILIIYTAMTWYFRSANVNDKFKSYGYDRPYQCFTGMTEYDINNNSYALYAHNGSSVVYYGDEMVVE